MDGFIPSRGGSQSIAKNNETAHQGIRAMCDIRVPSGAAPHHCLIRGSLSVPAGVGVAACPILRVLVTSTHLDDSLSVFALVPCRDCAHPSAGPLADLAPVCTLGGVSSAFPMQFKFFDGRWSGWMAFTGPASRRLLLLTDAGHDAVHVIDVVGRTHAGYVCTPGVIVGPRGVAASGSHAAISAWRGDASTGHVVHVFQGSGAVWAPVWVVGGSASGLLPRLWSPHALRFTRNDTQLVVGECDHQRLSLFRVDDGSFVQCVHTPGAQRHMDVEECDGGWLVPSAEGPRPLLFVPAPEEDGKCLDVAGTDYGIELGVTALTMVPGLGLVVRDFKRVVVFGVPSMVAMDALSATRVAWIGVVLRATRWRRARSDQPECHVSQAHPHPHSCTPACWPPLSCFWCSVRSPTA